MKFAHMGDCHLGGWRQPELKELNFNSFQRAVEICIREKVEFVLIAGDLFDSAYPPIDTLKDTFKEFRKLVDAKIPVFIIAGSHDYSASGKTFLDVLEKAGFCKNVALFEERNGKILLEPIIYKDAAIYGYPGKKSSLEVEDIERIRLQDAPGFFKILMLHTAIRDAVGTLPIKAVDERMLPQVDYLALAHLHINYQKESRVYCGPIFPNNLAELEELEGGSFYIIDNGMIKRQELKLKPVISMTIEITNALRVTEEILKRLEKESLRDKILIVKLYGFLEKGKTSDIDFTKIENYAKKQGAYVFLKSTTKLQMAEQEITFDFSDTQDMEQQIIHKFEESHPNSLNTYIFPLIKTLQMEKGEDEKSSVFEERLIAENRKILTL